MGNFESTPLALDAQSRSMEDEWRKADQERKQRLRTEEEQWQQNEQAKDAANAVLGFEWLPDLDEVEPAPPEYLVPGILAAGKPAFLIGPEKCLKSSIALDLGLSLASGTHFLNKFRVPEQHNVALILAENGKAWAEQKLKQIGRSKQRFWRVNAEAAREEWAFFDWPPLDFGAVRSRLEISFTRPVLHGSSHLGWRYLEALEKWLELAFIDVLILDPFYRCDLGDVNPSDPYAMAHILDYFERICQKTGTTLIITDHGLRGQKDGLPSLQNTAWSPMARFAPQWLLLGHHRSFDTATGTAHLRLTVGGRDGHMGQYELTVCEGPWTGGDCQRQWEVRVCASNEGASKAAKRESRTEDIQKVLAAVDSLAGEAGGAPGFEQVLKKAGLSRKRMEAAVETLKRTGQLEEVPTMVPIGKGRKRKAKGLTRVQEQAAGQVEGQTSAQGQDS